MLKGKNEPMGLLLARKKRASGLKILDFRFARRMQRPCLGALEARLKTMSIAVESETGC